MEITSTTPLRELALHVPGASLVLEEHGLDFGAWGGRSLGEACREAQLPLEPLLGELRAAQRGALGPAPDEAWTQAPLSVLVERLVTVHHLYARAELERLDYLLSEALRAGPPHPQLVRLAELLATLDDELEPHLLEEERVLFPYIVGLEAALQQGQPAPHTAGDSLAHRLVEVSRQHASEAVLLRELREVTAGYSPPPQAGVAERTLFQGVASLAHNLTRHMHLEANVLFPRARELELEVNR